MPRGIGHFEGWRSSAGRSISRTGLCSDQGDGPRLDGVENLRRDFREIGDKRVAFEAEERRWTHGFRVGERKLVLVDTGFKGDRHHRDPTSLGLDMRDSPDCSAGQPQGRGDPSRSLPTINRAYAELERHYSFVVDPAKVATPEHKGKVERLVPVVRQQLVAGRSYRDLAELNDKALIWCREQVGREIHGTTCEAPMTRFETIERGALLPLPAQAFDPPTWAEATVHPDHHLVFERSYYSLPTRFVGKTVWVRATRRLVEIYCDDLLVKTHPRATRRGTWRTDQNDYPDAAKAFLFAHPAYCRKKAAELGPHVARMVEAILADHAIRNLRKAQGGLRLAEKYGSQKLDEACDYLLQFEATELRRLNHVLENGPPLYWKSTQQPQSAPLTEQAQSFLHSPESFAAREVGR